MTIGQDSYSGMDLRLCDGVDIWWVEVILEKINMEQVGLRICMILYIYIEKNRGIFFVLFYFVYM